jgi:GNAT superfamily N-acetyltransferase
MPASPTGQLTVRKVDNPADFKVFFEFPWTVYKGDPNWVPPLLSLRHSLLDKKKNPAWEYLEGDYFVAYRGATPVGTIAAFINHNHNKFWKENIGFFGFFECFDDQEAATALLKTAAEYVKSLGATEGLRGPANFTVTDECALLIENFSRPVVLMPYNHVYYQRLIEESGLGFAKIMDLYSYYTNPDMILEDPAFVNKLSRVVERTKERNHITIRTPVPGKLKVEVDLILHMYDTAWERNWGFYPATKREADKLYTDLKDFVETDLIRFAVIDGKNVGFFLALPDLNEVLHLAYPRPGEPELWTLLKILFYWKVQRRIKGQRVVFMGVEPEYRGKGSEAAMMQSFLQDGLVHRRYYGSDLGWVLESNQPMNQLATTYKAKLYKKYRFYQKPL